MYKFIISIKREFLQLINDRVGLLLMFLLPLFLVLIITIVQDSAYKIVNENKVSVVIVNKDTGEYSTRLISLIKQSRMFDVEIDNKLDTESINNKILDENVLTAIYIPGNFSSQLQSNAKELSQTLMQDIGLNEQQIIDSVQKKPLAINFYHDPVLQDNYSASLMGLLQSLVGSIENSLILKSIYTELGIEDKSDKLQDKILENQVVINIISASKTNKSLTPNSTQHNVPAWTIFAMFFMVVSLGGNIVKERINGSFIRLKTMPTSFAMVLTAKMVLFIIMAILQVILIFSVGIFLFPYINLPQLELPDNILSLFIFVLVSAFAAVSYALMIGSVSKTQEQSNGIGAISIIIFAAIGGIWVPTFVMPDYMQSLSNLSPLQWCLKGFYILFLKGGNWSDLFRIILFLLAFIIINITISFIKLKRERIL